MKAILEYNLPEDAHSFAVAVKANDWNTVVSDLDEYLRTEIKHREYKEHSEEYCKALQVVRDRLLIDLQVRGLLLG
jgi:hypothetical protein